MTQHQQNDLVTAGESTIIGGVVTFLIEQILPWTIHTLSGILTALVISFCVYKFNKWQKRNDK